MLDISSPSVRKSLERLFSRKMLGSVLVGKFIGDFAGHIATGLLGVYTGDFTGIIIALLIFIYWDKVATAAKQNEHRLEGQSSLSDFNR